MPKTLWRGTLFVYNYRTREFLRHVSTMGATKRPDDPGSLYCRWTPSVRLARAYSNPGSAHKAAARINAEVYRHNSAKYPCAPVDVVTGEAARCLEMINRREPSGRQQKKVRT